MQAEHQIRKRRRGENRQAIQAQAQAAPPVVQVQVPINLGKPSLRKRLEDYYSLIAPETIANEKEWRQKYNLIWDKYGGSAEKELMLARKLAKKYGDTVRLKLTTNDNKNNTEDNSTNIHKTRIKTNPEEYYQPTSIQINSGIIDFLSVGFDPSAALLSSSPAAILAANPFVKNAPLLDNIDKFRVFLPECDPMRRIVTGRRVPPNERNANDTKGTNSGSGGGSSEMRNKIPVFTAMASRYQDNGPLSLLHSIHTQRQRVRVMVRYVDCIRGTLTGYLIAFDKHMNMLLRDVDEVYTSRITQVLGFDDKDEGGSSSGCGKGSSGGGGKLSKDCMGMSKSELELIRRQCVERAWVDGRKTKGHLDRNRGRNKVRSRNENRKTEQKQCSDNSREESSAAGLGLASRVKVGKRHLQQILVRGDNVVSVWRAGSERRNNLLTKGGKCENTNVNEK